jgi:hypothetical protein
VTRFVYCCNVGSVYVFGIWSKGKGLRLCLFRRLVLVAFRFLLCNNLTFERSNMERQWATTSERLEYNNGKPLKCHRFWHLTLKCHSWRFSFRMPPVSGVGSNHQKKISPQHNSYLAIEELLVGIRKPQIGNFTTTRQVVRLSHTAKVGPLQVPQRQ